jgi:serine/threonine protein kinase
MLLGLHHMHSRKVLHRDMKTLNTFLDQTLNVKLGDLGVAKVRHTRRVHAINVAGFWYGMGTLHWFAVHNLTAAPAAAVAAARQIPGPDTQHEAGRPGRGKGERGHTVHVLTSCSMLV